MPTKDDSMRENGSFNSNYGKVTAGLFESSPFFDKKNIVQVKYEMVRAATNGEGSISEIAGAHGFSRKTYYQVSKSLEAGGLCALVPKKTGPKGPLKLKEDVSAFVDAFHAEHGDAGPSEISAALEAETGVRVHPRTIYRYLKKN